MAAAIWLVVGGRGSGKTRLGAEWTNGLAMGLSPFAVKEHGRLALVGETLGDVRDVMIEGPSGILACARAGEPRYEPSRRRVVWRNGAVAHAFSSEDPDSLRGPQFEAAWSDEIAKWRYPQESWDMLQFGLRLGDAPRQIATTTPKAVPLLRALMADPAVTVTRMRTTDNAAHLAAGFIGAVLARYGGTRLGRQELDGELIDDREDALWTRAVIDAAYMPGAPVLNRIVVAVDPPATAHRTSDACGIVAAGLDAQGRAVVVADASVQSARPQEWAEAATKLYRLLQADCLLAEVNQGGDMVAAVIATVDAAIPVKPVRARRGKWTRAEPVAMLYQQGKVLHAGRFAALEDEMCDFGPDGLSGGRSPDRVDALVWAVSELLAGHLGEPRIRDLNRS
jgi:phage terminase large subunit-like protein